MQIVAAARDGFASRRTLPLEFRLRQLRKLRSMVEENRERFLAALDHDLRKVRKLWLGVVGVLASLLHDAVLLDRLSHRASRRLP